MRDRAVVNPENMKNEIKDYFGTQLKKTPSLIDLYKTIKNDLNEVEKTLRLFSKS